MFLSFIDYQEGFVKFVNILKFLTPFEINFPKLGQGLQIFVYETNSDREGKI